ncbi:MAG: hypothetical protein FWB80_05260 [Defluviitaleaceae bacterium]|nr:hypothetical protein [Defluviitaleaceae bacterium]
MDAIFSVIIVCLLCGAILAFNYYFFTKIIKKVACINTAEHSSHPFIKRFFMTYVLEHTGLTKWFFTWYIISVVATLTSLFLIFVEVFFELVFGRIFGDNFIFVHDLLGVFMLASLPVSIVPALPYLLRLPKNKKPQPANQATRHITIRREKCKLYALWVNYWCVLDFDTDKIPTPCTSDIDCIDCDNEQCDDFNKNFAKMMNAIPIKNGETISIEIDDHKHELFIYFDNRLISNKVIIPAGSVDVAYSIKTTGGILKSPSITIEELL